MNLFHLHTFDPKGWEETASGSIYYGDAVLPHHRYIIYRNTCLTCGDLVAKKIKT